MGINHHINADMSPRVRRPEKVQGPQVSQPVLAFPLRARTRYPKGPTGPQVRDCHRARQREGGSSFTFLWTRLGMTWGPTRRNLWNTGASPWG